MRDVIKCSKRSCWSSSALSRTGMEVLEEDVVALMRKRVYDLSGVLGKTVKVRPCVN